MPLPYGFAVYDDRYIYLEEVVPYFEEYEGTIENQSFYVFDRNYELIASSIIPFHRRRGYNSFMAATDDRILFSVRLFPQGFEYYIDKSDIASGDIVWHEAR